jgi:hypothetical protein
MDKYATRFWTKVIKGQTCWLWTGATNAKGYGIFGFRDKLMRAHRVAYMLTHGPIVDGLLVCHRCDTPACVRPDHLFVGTAADNTKDARRKGRLKSGRQKQTNGIHKDVHHGKLAYRALQWVPWWPGYPEGRLLTKRFAITTPVATMKAWRDEVYAEAQRRRLAKHAALHTVAHEMRAGGTEGLQLKRLEPILKTWTS